MKQLLSITLHGKQRTWAFEFHGDPKHIDEWRADGLKVHVIQNKIPTGIVDMGLTRIWCFIQDILNFKVKQ